MDKDSSGFILKTRLLAAPSLNAYLAPIGRAVRRGNSIDLDRALWQFEFMVRNSTTEHVVVNQATIMQMVQEEMIWTHVLGGLFTRDNVACDMSHASVIRLAAMIQGAGRRYEVLVVTEPADGVVGEDAA